MEKEKSQWRTDVESRLAQAKSPSQKLRFAIFELSRASGEDPSNFDSIYNEWIESRVNDVLDEAQSAHDLLNQNS